MSSLFFLSSVNTLPMYLTFGTCVRASSSVIILIFSRSLEQTITSVSFPVNFYFAVTFQNII